MPAKGDKKKGRIRGKRAEGSDDEYNSNDAASCSSENKSVDIDIDTNDNDDNNNNQQILFEDKLKQKIDDMTDKSLKTRIDSFIAIEKIFATKVLSEFVDERKATLSDAIERALKKGDSQEIIIAAKLTTSLCIQLGAYDTTEVIWENFKPILMTIANDHTASPNARAECCWALGINQFLACDDDLDSLQLLTLFYNIFCGSFLKGNGSVKILSNDVHSLHSSALGAWTLLLIELSPSNLIKYLTTIKTPNSITPLEGLCELLNSTYLETRVTAGEALAAIIEITRDYTDDFEDELPYDIADTLENLSKDGTKYRNKKDRKEQRAEFREIHKYFTDDIVPSVHVKFNTREKLYFDTWTSRIQYNALCRPLGPGINTHLADNMMLRDMFQLGNRVSSPLPKTQKSTKLERTLQNAAAFKARTIQRSRNRDKRSAAIAQ